MIGRLIFIAPWLALALMAARRLVLPGARRDEAPALPSLSPAGRAWLAALVAGGVGLRWACARAYPPYELGAVLQACDFRFDDWLLDSRDLSRLLHAPLQRILIHYWLGAGERLGVRFDLLGLRAPNLVLSAIAIVLVARIGVLLRSPRAGLAAATLFAFNPMAVLTSIPQELYLLETTATLWFVERLLLYVSWRRPVYRSLALAGAAALWSGFMSVLVLLPGFLLLAGVAWRRRQGREAVYTLALAALWLAPLARIPISVGIDYIALSLKLPSAPTGDHGAGEFDSRNSFSQGHFLTALRWLAESVTGIGGHLFLAGALLLIIRQRLRALPLLAVPLAYAVASWRIFFLPHNVSAVIPFISIACAWGWDGVVEWSRESWPRGSRWLAPCIHAATVTIALTTAHAEAPLFGPEHRYFPYWYWPVRPFARETAALPPGRPVLLYGVPDMEAEVYYLCANSASTCDQLRCAAPSDPPQQREVWPLLVSKRADREVALVNRSFFELTRRQPAMVQSAERLEVLPEWRASPWIAIRATDRCDDRLVAIDHLLQRHCASRADTPSHRFYDCPAAPAAGEGANAGLAR